VNTNSLFDRVVIDSKAMRKMKALDQIVLMAEVCDSTDQGGTFDYNYGLRILSAS